MMDRKKFLKKGFVGISAVVAIPTVMSSCNNDEDATKPITDPSAGDSCAVSPTETAGPFPIKTPADWVRENIAGDRQGIPMMINFTIENTNNNCEPLEGVYVDIWHCDANGNYSEYNGQLDGDFTGKHFLRGRQKTNANGEASFISIYPGWYPGRAPHLHVEIKDSSEKSLLITQTAFPEEASKAVYATANYKGVFDTPNADDLAFENSSEDVLALKLTGNTTDGYTTKETIKVKGS